MKSKKLAWVLIATGAVILAIFLCSPLWIHHPPANYSHTGTTTLNETSYYNFPGIPAGAKISLTWEYTNSNKSPESPKDQVTENSHYSSWMWAAFVGVIPFAVGVYVLTPEKGKEQK